MYCSKCGTKNSLNGLFCKKCGASLVDEVLENQAYEDDNKFDKGKDTQNSKSITRNKTVNKTTNKTVEKRAKEKNKDKKNKDRSRSDRVVETKIVQKSSAFQKFMIFFLIFMIIVLMGALVIAGLYIFQDKTIEVPNVVGVDVDQATLMLENIDLRVKVKEKKVDSEAQDHIVLEQSKDTGEFVLKYTKIVLIVGSYDSNKLDSFVGMNIDDAISELKKLGIEYEIKEVDSSDEDGIVISQSPTAGNSYDKSTKVLLTVSKKVEASKEEDSKEDSTIIEEDNEKSPE